MSGGRNLQVFQSKLLYLLRLALNLQGHILRRRIKGLRRGRRLRRTPLREHWILGLASGNKVNKKQAA